VKSPAYVSNKMIAAPLRLRRLWFAIGCFGIGLLFWLSLARNPLDLGLDSGNWSGHFLAYSMLMGWFARLSDDRWVRRRSAIMLVAIGIVIECLQGLVPWRTFDPLDMLANTFGVLLGWIASPPRVPSGFPRVERLLLRG
jgi:VanZ family protein